MYIYPHQTHNQAAQVTKLNDMECNSSNEDGLKFLMQATELIEELLHWFYNKIN